MSFIPRLFLPPISPDQKEILLDELASRYLVKVLRLAEGSKFFGFDNQGFQYDLTLKNTGSHSVTASVLLRKPIDTGISQGVLVLAQGLPKASKMDLILRQGTEVGLDRFIPLVTRRSISRPDVSQHEHKNERWQKILVEACRQCGRNDLPRLDPVTSWNDLLGSFQEFDLVLLPYEKEAPTLASVLESRNHAGKILILIGPEGGWSTEEVREAEEKGALPVHLPTPILRTETAGVAVAAMLQFFKSHTSGNAE